jgi:hypothetical protein
MSGAALGSLANDTFDEQEEKENEVEEIGIKKTFKIGLLSLSANNNLVPPLDEDFPCNDEESEALDDKTKQAKQPVWKRPQKKKTGKKQSGSMTTKAPPCNLVA